MGQNGTTAFNNLVGTIPTTIGQMVALSSLGLSNNTLTGPIPTEIEQLASLKYLFLGT